jgi:tmRNA-binding protein
VVEVFQDQEALFDNRMALLAFDVRDKADAAGIVLILWVVKALRLHGGTPKNCLGSQRIVQCNKGFNRKK